MGRPTRMYIVYAMLFAGLAMLQSACVVELTADQGCLSGADCFVGEVCDPTGNCVPDCAVDGCAQAGELCDEVSGLCFSPECSVNEECFIGEFCGLDGFCYEYNQACLDSADCVGDGICTSTNVCDMNYECIDDLDCPWVGSMCNEFGFCEYLSEF